MTSLFGTDDIKRVRRVALAISALAWLSVIARPTEGHHIHHGPAVIHPFLILQRDRAHLGLPGSFLGNTA